MKINFEKEAAFLKQAADKVGKAGNKAAIAVKDGVQAISDKAQEASATMQEKSYEERLKKYNPLFPNQYKDADFNIPNLIRIVDDAVRKNIDVCEGAIGWCSKEKGVEVLHLYDEAIAFSELKFLPAATCDTVYYVDPFDRNRYISLESFFDTIQQSKLAELQHIAFSLGAKGYCVEMAENSKEFSSAKKSGAIKGIKGVNAQGSRELTVSTEKASNALARAEWSNSRKPVRPNLLWYANDDNVRNLIAMCCSENRMEMTSYTIELRSSSSATMSTSTAAKIDAAAGKMGVSSNFGATCANEYNKTMLFRLEF